MITYAQLFTIRKGLTALNGIKDFNLGVQRAKVANVINPEIEAMEKALENKEFFNLNQEINSLSTRAYGMSVRLIKEGSYTQEQYNAISSDIISIDGISYGLCYNSVTGKIWLDRNLGASQVATSSTDASAYGWLFQWGREADGHQVRTSSTTTSLSSNDAPGHNKFITINSSPNDWRSPQNDNLWQTPRQLVDNNGYRVPSDADWTQLIYYLIDENWCNGVAVTISNIAQFLKSCRQVNHPLA